MYRWMLGIPWSGRDYMLEDSAPTVVLTKSIFEGC